MACTANNSKVFSSNVADDVTLEKLGYQPGKT